ncbi:MAG: multidrug effflux MFS transporter, partial [Janthinobacterium lividum]
MNVSAPVVAEVPHPGMGFREFVGFIAALMAVNALGVDSMLPALPAMGHALGIASENQRQWIIAVYVLGFGAAQLVYGPLADRFGRRRVLLGGLTLFVVASVLAGLATDFASIVAARLLQGIVAAAGRVLSVSIVRDCYSGRTMARVMSLAFMTLLAVPILAPSLGQFILLWAPWQGIFVVLALFGAAVGTWAAFRLPETLHPEDRRRFDVRDIVAAAKTAATNRYSLGYTLASTLLFGSIMGYVNSVQQIFEHVFHATQWFTTIFALTAAFMAVAAFTNSRIVERLGMRHVSHAALLSLIVIASIHAA